MQKREDCKTTSTINFNQKLEPTARPRRANAFTVLNYTVVSRSKVSYSTCRPQVCVEKLISSSCKSERKREQEREREREREREKERGKERKVRAPVAEVSVPYFTKNRLVPSHRPPILGNILRNAGRFKRGRTARHASSNLHVIAAGPVGRQLSRKSPGPRPRIFCLSRTRSYAIN